MRNFATGRAGTAAEGCSPQRQPRSGCPQPRQILPAADEYTIRAFGFFPLTP